MNRPAQALRALVMPLALCASASAMQIPHTIIETTDYVKLFERGRAEYIAGRFREAERLLQSALTALGGGNETERAVILRQLGDVYVNVDDLPKAEKVYLESLAIHKRLSDKQHIGVLFRNLGAVYSLEGRNEDALQALRQALKFPPVDPSARVAFTAQVLNSVGVAYYRQRKISKAEAAFNQALELVSDAKIRFDSSELLNNLGAAKHARHQFQEAEQLFRQALQLREADAGPMHPDLVYTLCALGVLYTEWGRYREAEDQYRRALKILESDSGTFEPRIARILDSLSWTYLRAGRPAESEGVLAEAATLARRNLSRHGDMAGILDHYSAALKKQGRTQEAEELMTEARRARVSAGLINAHKPF